MKLFTSTLILICLISLVGTDLVLADDNKRLESIRLSIQEQEKQLLTQKKQKEKLVNDLQAQETAIANLLASIEKNTSQLNQINKAITTLSQQTTDLELQKKIQQNTLAKLLVSAFKLGRTTSLDLIFANEESSRNERIIVYYGYINKEKEAQIATLEKTKAELDEKKQSLEKHKIAQETLQQQQNKSKNELEKNRLNRQKTIASLDTMMQVSEQKLAELRENEAALQTQIAQAEKENKKIAEQETKQANQIIDKQKNFKYTPSLSERALMARVSGIGLPKKMLNWPVAGLVAHNFGEIVQGELYWKGMVINAKSGTPVKAIADGRVILASWLQGYGFIVAIEHGKGDMSLYGYNQRMLVNVGDNVETGQTIALVGATGGRSTPSLYFEIRRDGIALDPSGWLKTTGKT